MVFVSDGGNTVRSFRSILPALRKEATGGQFFDGVLQALVERIQASL
jgi:hypothetical protein